VDGWAGLDAALAQLGTPAVLKTRRFGYDGKGQARIMAPDEAEAAWAAVRGAPCVLEGFVRFDAEFSILLCRGQDGETLSWDAPRNVHKDGILDSSTVPAGPDLEPAIAKGRALAGRIAAALDYVGVMAVEFFALGDEAIFNEMAPRVHNSGHWTIEGALTSQFENHVRAICGLPLGDTALSGAGATMTNLIGTDADGWADILAAPGAHLHLYGKGDARPGRKMGHVTRVGND
jgi:5-(carboxyamino)imidazole ribonucleotide synthase